MPIWYGYDWNTSTLATVNYVAFRDVAAKTGVHAYGSSAQAPSLHYSSRGQAHEIWYENAQSVGAKLDVVTSQGLGCLAPRL